MAETMLGASGLTRRFGGLTAVDRVSIDLERDAIHALIGPNGAGKSTLINLLSGALDPSEGSISFRGEPVPAGRPERMAHLGIGRTFQRSNLFHDFTCFENCRLAAQARTPRPWAIFEPALRCARSKDAAERALATVGLGDRRNVPASALSHGDRRALEIAICLAADPQVLLLDEPLAGMGTEESQRTLQLLRELKRERAILLVEHDMDAVFAVADVITVMADGAVLASGPPDAVRGDRAVGEAYLGEAL